MARPNVRSVSPEPAKTMRVRVLYYFISTHDFQIGAPAVAGISASSVPFRRTRLSPMTVPFGYMFYDNTEIDSESCEVTESDSPGEPQDGLVAARQMVSDSETFCSNH